MLCDPAKPEVDGGGNSHGSIGRTVLDLLGLSTGTTLASSPRAVT